MFRGVKFVYVAQTDDGLVTSSIRNTDTSFFAQTIGPNTLVCVFREGVKVIQGSLYTLVAIENRLAFCGLKIQPADIITSESDNLNSRVSLICVEVPPSRG